MPLVQHHFLSLLCVYDPASQGFTCAFVWPRMCMCVCLLRVHRSLPISVTQARPTCVRVCVSVHFTSVYVSVCALQIPPNQRYKSPGEAYVEGDASSASYFLAGATITGGTVVVEGCGSDSLQGDVRFAEVSMGERVSECVCVCISK